MAHVKRRRLKNKPANRYPDIPLGRGQGHPLRRQPGHDRRPQAGTNTSDQKTVSRNLGPRSSGWLRGGARPT